MKAQHTPEPWNYSGTLNGLDVVIHQDKPGYDTEALNGRNDRTIATVRLSVPITVIDGEKHANAARIVACVNACAGLADPAADLAALREALREAMIAMTTTRTTEGCSPFMAGAIDKARAALDRVQGKEAE